MKATNQQIKNTKSELTIVNGSKCKPIHELGYLKIVEAKDSMNGCLSNKQIEFENRRRARLEEKAMLKIQDNGMIRDCNNTAGELLDYSPSELMGQHISKVFPQLAEIKLVQMQRVNPYLRELSRERHPFKVVSKHGTNFACELFFRDMESQGLYQLCVIIYPVKQMEIVSQQIQANCFFK